MPVRLIQNKKGFSIGENLIAIFIVAVAVTAMLGLIIKTMKTSTESRNAVIAAGLAQEGVELMRNVRDNNLLNNAAFNTWFTGTTYCIDATMATSALSANLPGCSSNVLKIDNSVYNYGTGVDSRYRRTIVVGTPTTAPAVRVTSYVWWGGEASAPNPCTSAAKCQSAAVTLENVVLGL